ncbi:hypothetical protein SSX86_021120 [Deinandra increscens subsp. villosa]|uniref:Partial AB-hydrolase lipase domain-containing protein n=1 Tax=Deinandra increscens subsp. villosa TaxID=3103831 RepID=A0AAP0CP52_9ASTR
MANILITTVTCVLVLFCSSALANQPRFFWNESTTVVSAASNADGICKSMVLPRGYPCEEHYVRTNDGFVLSLQRIPLGRAGGKKGIRVPVLLQHGLLMDGITWLLSPPDQSLALVLADNGFDVWIVSSRGTKYSRGHAYLKPEDEGTLTAMAALSKGELVSMLRSAGLLSPVAYVGQITSPLGRTAAENFIAEALKWLGLHEFNPKGDTVTKFLKKICARPGIDCTNLLNSFTVIRDGMIRMYDYKDAGQNRRRYGQPTPPAYNIANIPKNVPLFLSHGGADSLSDVNDVNHLLRTLKHHDKDKMVVQFIKAYAHADFVMATNARQVIEYDKKCVSVILAKDQCQPTEFYDLLNVYSEPNGLKIGQVAEYVHPTEMEYDKKCVSVILAKDQRQPTEFYDLLNVYSEPNGLKIGQVAKYVHPIEEIKQNVEELAAPR